MRLAYALTIGALLAGSAASLAADQASAPQTSAAPAVTADSPSEGRGPQNPQGMEAGAPRPGAPMSFADLTAQLQPAVVNISTTQRVEVGRTINPFGGPGGPGGPGGGNPLEEFFRRFQQPPGQGDDGQPVTRRATSLGSGFIISPDGYIVTNNHVVTGRNDNDAADTITVTLADKREFKARLIGRDPATDLALLKIEATALPYVRFEQAQPPRVGDWVIAIGNPFNLGGTVTAGIVSGLNRRDIGGQYDDFIQTDASINQGNSGGPLFDLRGNVVGVNSVILSPNGGNIGVGFSISAKIAKPVIDQLRESGRVRRGYVGVSIQPLNEDIAASLGLEKNRGEIVANVEPSGPAARAGLRQGDVIVAVNGEPVTDNSRLSPLIAKQRIGSTVPVDIIRNGQRQTVRLAIAERPNDQQLAGRDFQNGDEESLAQQRPDQDAQAARASLGVTLQSLTPVIRQQLRVPADTQGVVIAGVNPSSDAAEKGLRRGDIIRSVNQQTVQTPQQAAAIVDQARRAGRKSVLLLVQRGANPAAFIGIELAGATGRG